MLAQRQRLSINVPKRDDCRDCTIPLRQHEDLVPQVGGIIGERTPSRCEVDALHSRTSSPPIIKMLLCFRPTARILTGPFASGRPRRRREDSRRSTARARSGWAATACGAGSPQAADPTTGARWHRGRPPGRRPPVLEDALEPIARTPPGAGSVWSDASVWALSPGWRPFACCLKQGRPGRKWRRKQAIGPERRRSMCQVGNSRLEDRVPDERRA